MKPRAGPFGLFLQVASPLMMHTAWRCGSSFKKSVAPTVCKALGSGPRYVSCPSGEKGLGAGAQVQALGLMPFLSLPSLHLL